MSLTWGAGPVPAVSVVMMSPEAVLVAPFSAAAFARKASPDFRSAAATTASREAWSPWILGPHSESEILGSFFSTPSVMPAFTASRSAAPRLKDARFWLRMSPSA